MNKRVLIASIFAVAGVVLLAWSFLPNRTPRQPQRASDIAAHQSTTNNSLDNDDNDFVEVKTTDALSQALSEARDALRSSLAHLPSDEQLPAEQQEAFLQDAVELWRIYLSADYDGYLKYVKEHDGQLPQPKEADTADNTQADDNVKEFWLSMVSGIAGGAIKPTGAFVLARWMGGRKIDHKPLATTSAIMTSKDRFDIPRDPEAASLTVYEALLPVQFSWGDTSGNVVFGVSLAWDATASRWVLWRLALYNTEGKARFLVCPTY